MCRARRMGFGWRNEADDWIGEASTSAMISCMLVARRSEAFSRMMAISACRCLAKATESLTYLAGAGATGLVTAIDTANQIAVGCPCPHFPEQAVGMPPSTS